MKTPRILAVVLAATLALAGCASAQSEAEESTTAPATQKPTETTDSYSLSATEICEMYMPTASGDHGPIAAKIMAAFEERPIDGLGVMQLSKELRGYENRGPEDMRAALEEFHRWIHDTAAAVEAGETSVNAQWVPGESFLGLMEDCVEEGYTVK